MWKIVRVQEDKKEYGPAKNKWICNVFSMGKV